jgi:hypothetical protein
VSSSLRAVTVPSVPYALAELTERCQRWPQAAAECDDVVRSIDPAGPTRAGVITESLASPTRRIGRWRTAYLVLSGRTIDGGHRPALGLIDEVR